LPLDLCLPGGNTRRLRSALCTGVLAGPVVITAVNVLAARASPTMVRATSVNFHLADLMFATSRA
jgi:hypothetical protein